MLHVTLRNAIVGPEIICCIFTQTYITMNIMKILHKKKYVRKRALNSLTDRNSQCVDVSTFWNQFRHAQLDFV